MCFCAANVLLPERLGARVDFSGGGGGGEERPRNDLKKPRKRPQKGASVWQWVPPSCLCTGAAWKVAQWGVPFLGGAMHAVSNGAFFGTNGVAEKLLKDKGSGCGIARSHTCHHAEVRS